MKKKIFLWVILILEAIIFISLGIIDANVNLQTMIPFNGLYLIGKYAHLFISNIMKSVKLDVLLEKMMGAVYPNVFVFITLIVFNIVFIGVYYLIFGILTIVFKNKREKKIRQIVTPYELSNSEYEKFNYKNYLHNAPVKRIISLIIPAVIIFFFICARFDKENCIAVESNIKGKLTLFSDYFAPAISNFISPKSASQVFQSFLHNSSGYGYVDLTNKLLGVAPWTEYGILVILSALILAAWFGLFSLINLIIRKPHAKRKSIKAKERYITKMENIEYKLHTKYKEETNIKADDFMHVLEKEQDDSASAIAKYRNEIPEQNETKDAEKARSAYYEEIGEGVSDLGVSEESSSNSKPVTEREIKYISDEEVDIILDEEPVIEIVESDDEETLDASRNDIFYERYQPDDNEIRTIEEYSGEEYNKEPFIQEEDELKEETTPEENIPQEEIKENTETVDETISEELNDSNEVMGSEESEKVIVSEEKAEENEPEPLKEEIQEENASEDNPIIAPLDETPLINDNEVSSKEEEIQANELKEEINDEETISESAEKEQIQEEVNEPEETKVSEEIQDAPNLEESTHEEESKEEIPSESVDEEIALEEKNIEEKTPDNQESNEPSLEEKESAPIEKVPEVKLKKSFADYIKRKPKPVEPVKEEDTNSFSKYKNRRNAPGYGAKRVPTFKEMEEEKKAKEPEVIYVNEDPFKDYRNTKKESGYGAKKVPSFKEMEESEKEDK